MQAQDKEPKFINLTPQPGEHFRILARLADADPGTAGHRYVRSELRRLADIYEHCHVTWDDLDAFLNKNKMDGEDKKKSGMRGTGR